MSKSTTVAVAPGAELDITTSSQDIAGIDDGLGTASTRSRRHALFPEAAARGPTIDLCHPPPIARPARIVCHDPVEVLAEPSLHQWSVAVPCPSA
jgi:hypothetical protein